MACMNIIKAGVLTTVQDLGRVGCQQQGLTEGGAFDRYAAICANALCDNSANTALFEIAIGGFECQVDTDCDIAITGAQLTVQINQRYVESWRTLRLHAGDRLKLGFAQYGARAYLAVRGGIQVPLYFGSASTVLREGVGCSVQAGDTFTFDRSDAIHPRRICVSQRPKWSSSHIIQILPVQHYWGFSRAARRAFFASPYTVNKQSDRMGYRLQGEIINYHGAGIVSQALALGTVQIPADGQPIIMCRDHQTMGGYPKIGCVIAPDIDKLAQLQPGASITFQPVSFGKASRIIEAYEKKLRHIEWQYVYE